MQCNLCGTNVTPQDKFCPVCGNKIEADQPSYNPQTDYTQSLYNDVNYNSPYQQQGGMGQQPYQQPYRQQYQQPYVQPSKQGGDGALKALLGVGVVLLLVAVSSLVYLVASSNRSNDRNETIVAENEKAKEDKAVVEEIVEEEDEAGEESNNVIYSEESKKDSKPSSSVQAAPEESGSYEGSKMRIGYNEAMYEASSNNYILPQSDSVYLTGADISHLSKSDLRIARNEIYARHGRRFKDSSLQSYFDSQSWYSGTIAADDFSDSILSKVEQSNVALIKSYEGGSSTKSKTGSEPAASSGDYILPWSSTSYLSSSDVSGLSKNELRLARNEIYARHGRKFNDSSLQSYFNGKSWYHGTIDPDNFSDDYLSAVEKENIKLIKSYE